MTQFDDRLEGEMKTHEAEMLHKAIIKKYGGLPLKDRIIYVMSIYHHESWGAADMYAKLKELDLIGEDSVQLIQNLFSDSSNGFPVNVIKQSP